MRLLAFRKRLDQNILLKGVIHEKQTDLHTSCKHDPGPVHDSLWQHRYESKP